MSDELLNCGKIEFEVLGDQDIVLPFRGDNKGGRSRLYLRGVPFA